jgi:NhaA family Na+:H+ antiporter
MSLFIATLAFEGENLTAQVRVGVLVASILSGLVAWLVLTIAARAKSVVTHQKARHTGHKCLIHRA